MEPTEVLVGAEDLAHELLKVADTFAYPTEAWSQAAGFELNDLESIYVRLFVNDLGGVKAPPFAGCYLDVNRLDFMEAFSGLARSSGIELDRSYPPDYIPMMLEVLAMMIKNEMAPEHVKVHLEDYFSLWPEAFVQRLQSHDDSGLYLEAARYLQQLLEDLVSISSRKIRI